MNGIRFIRKMWKSSLCKVTAQELFENFKRDGCPWPCK